MPVPLAPSISTVLLLAAFYAECTARLRALAEAGHDVVAGDLVRDWIRSSQANLT